MNLQLSLTHHWFEMTGDPKMEDYREITPYFCNKFLLSDGMVKPRKWWAEFLDTIPSVDCILENGSGITSKPFVQNVMTDAYPSIQELDRFKRFKHAGIEIRTGRPEWGAEEGKIYFVIKHGEKV